MKIKEAIAGLKKDMIYPIYLLKGNDYFLQNFFIEKLSEEYFGSSKIEKVPSDSTFFEKNLNNKQKQ